jgi:hypothetical protein
MWPFSKTSDAPPSSDCRALRARLVSAVAQKRYDAVTLLPRRRRNLLLTADKRPSKRPELSHFTVALRLLCAASCSLDRLRCPSSLVWLLVRLRQWIRAAIIIRPLVRLALQSRARPVPERPARSALRAVARGERPQWQARRASAAPRAPAQVAQVRRQVARAAEARAARVAPAVAAACPAPSGWQALGECRPAAPRSL